MVRLPNLTVSAGSGVPEDPPRPPGPRFVGPGFVSLYALSYAGGALVFLAPLLISLALKVNSLVGIDEAPKNLALVTGVGSLLAIVSNPFFGRLSDRTTSRLGMRRPWMLVGLAGGTIGTVTVAVAPSIPVVLLGWCVCQVFFNALLAAQVAVLHDQVPTVQRGVVSGVLGVCLPGRVRGRHLPGAGVRPDRADHVPGRRVSSAAPSFWYSQRGCATFALTPPTGSRGRCASWPAPSTSTPDATRTSRGRSRHASSS